MIEHPVCRLGVLLAEAREAVHLRRLASEESNQVTAEHVIGDSQLAGICSPKCIFSLRQTIKVDVGAGKVSVCHGMAWIKLDHSPACFRCHFKSAKRSGSARSQKSMRTGVARIGSRP